MATVAHVRWEKGGEASVETAEGDLVTLVSTMSSAPGSRIAGALEGGAPIRVKVARCRRRDGAQDPPSYVIEGRLLDASRRLREALAALALAAASAEGEPRA